MPRAKNLSNLLVVVGLGIAVATAAPVAAQEPSAQDLAAANNPLANMTAFNLRNYFIPKFTDAPDTSANQFWIPLCQAGWSDRRQRMSTKNLTPSEGTAQGLCLQAGRRDASR